MALKNFEELLERYRQTGQRHKVAIVCPSDDHTEYVVRRCVDEDIVDLILLTDGNESTDFDNFCNAHESEALVRIKCADTLAAVQTGVALVHDGDADVLMKGSVNTDVVLRAVIDKDGGRGLLNKGDIMSHVTLVEAPSYHKLLLFSDAAVIPNPDINQFDAMVLYDTHIARSLGIECPKVALIHFTEKSNPRFPVTTDYATIISRAADGYYGKAIIGGPMDVKTACDAESAAIKHIASPVTGDADILIMPDLEAGNTFYKTVSFFGRARMAGLVTGTTAPVVVGSRADSAESKFFSLILACLSYTKLT